MKLRFALAAAALIAVPAFAAPAPDQAMVRSVLGAYGACIVKREPDLARTFVLSGEFLDPKSDGGKRLVQGECLKDNLRRLSMGNGALKGAIAQSLFDRDAASLTATSFTGVPALVNAQPWPVKTVDARGDSLREDVIARQQRAFDQKAGEVLRAKLAECVVRTDGANARAALTTAPGTEAELAALKALSASLNNCVVKGETVGFDRMTLRGSLATAYYRLATAAKTTGAAQ